MKEIADGWFQLSTEYLDLCGLPLYLHAFADSEGIVLLDSGVAGTPERSVRPELAAAGLDIGAISLVVNSHAHPDHMGGNAALAALADPVFAGPALEAGWLESNDLLIDQLWEPNPDAYRLTAGERAELLALLGERPRVDRLLRDGDEITVADTSVQVISTSGHSPGHLAVFDPHRRLLFTFDDVQGSGVPIAHSDVQLAPLYHDVRRYREGLGRLAELDFDLMLPSHGDPLPAEQAHSRIAESLSFLDRAEEFVLDYLDGTELADLGELARGLGTRFGPYGGVTLQTMSIAKAHLEELVRRQLVQPLFTRTPTRSPEDSR